MGTQLNGRGRRPTNRKPRKSSYVKVADRVAAEQAVQKEFAFAQNSDGPVIVMAGDGPKLVDSRLEGVLQILTSLTVEERHRLLDFFHPGSLLDSLGRRGGTLKACADAQLLVLKKSADYNAHSAGAGSFSAQRDDYFPFGLKSYAQMLHTKSQRLISLAHKADGANFESARDTMLDLINYASFGADWLERTQG